MASINWIRLSANTIVFWLGMIIANIALASDPRSIEFFESRIRPVLIQNCYECHSSTKTLEANLSLDFRDGLLRGGDSGPAISPGMPDDSLLLQVIEHRAGDLKMPPSGIPLSAEILDDFRRWIAAGAADPRDHPPPENEASDSSDWQKILEARKSWWSFQPIQKVAVPEPNSVAHPIDQFVNQKLTERGLQPSQRASNEVLIRRVYWNLIGLPPSRDELARWTEALGRASSTSELQSGEFPWHDVWGQLVDSLLQDPRFGERWARHWMDWIRYAESHGSEGDPAIVNAWLYRDYLIRALNRSVPLDLMIREHIAGDLLPPRIEPGSHLNQALIATAHWRMVFHGFSPVDAMEERVRFTDDQINSFSKAFLGVTVSCARCHDHKFDPISQADYYALFGVLSSCRPGRRPADDDAVLRQHHSELRRIQAELQAALIERWKESVKHLPSRLGLALDSVIDKPHPELTLGQIELKSAWEHREQESTTTRIPAEDSSILHWDMTRPSDVATWTRVGTGLEHQQLPGDPVIAASGERALLAIHSGGVSSRALSEKEAARISSPDFISPPESVLWVLCEGDGGAALRYAVEDYPRSGTIYPVYPLKPGLRWIQSDLSYWAGDTLHIEISNAADAPLLTGSQPRSWFRVHQVWVLPKGQQPARTDSLHRRLGGKSASEATISRDAWIHQFELATKTALEHWSNQTLSDDEAEMLDLLLRNDILPNDLNDPTIHQLVQRYREIEAQMVTATRVPCLEETPGQDSALLIRGDHRQPDQKVPRRFLEVIDGRPFETLSSGRLELAAKVLDPHNPLTRRVLANRVWQHLFGTGIVKTSDNLGRLGEEPRHPELLDWLAERLPQLGWSLKGLIREIVTTETWLRSSAPDSEAFSIDPENRLLGRASVRRYEAEAIRDALLYVSGSLDSTMWGPPQPVDGLRRSIYLPVIRNSLIPLLRTFDFPEPAASVGKRDQTNVPAQSLALMNDPNVAALARRWAENSLATEPNPEKRARIMLESALSRTTSQQEVTMSLEFIEETKQNFSQLLVQAEHLSQRIDAIQDEMRQLEAPNLQLLRNADNSNSDPNLHANTENTSRVPTAGSLDQWPQPVLHWDFSIIAESDAKATLELIGSAEIMDGGLVVREGGYALSPLQTGSLREKTLAAWVQLDNLDQRGGGVISVQSTNGEVFDAIVFGEQMPGHWLAGSNFFARTQNLKGDAESEAAQRPIHLAMVYQADGQILAYRNGKLYGQPYLSSGPHDYSGAKWLVSLGLRHLPAVRDKTLSGKIWSASVYDQALTPEQISALAGNTEMPIGKEKLLAAMPQETREKWQTLDKSRESLKNELAETVADLPIKWNRREAAQHLSADDMHDLELLSWTNFARAVFTLKEFIYVP